MAYCVDWSRCCRPKAGQNLPRFMATTTMMDIAYCASVFKVLIDQIYMDNSPQVQRRADVHFHSRTL